MKIKCKWLCYLIEVTTVRMRWSWRHNFVEYPKAGREGKISTLPAQAATESIMSTLTAPGCHSAIMIHSGSPRLSKGDKLPPWQPHVIRESIRCTLVALLLTCGYYHASDPGIINYGIDTLYLGFKNFVIEVYQLPAQAIEVTMTVTTNSRCESLTLLN